MLRQWHNGGDGAARRNIVLGDLPAGRAGGGGGSRHYTLHKKIRYRSFFGSENRIGTKKTCLPSDSIFAFLFNQDIYQDYLLSRKWSSSNRVH